MSRDKIAVVLTPVAIAAGLTCVVHAVRAHAWAWFAPALVLFVVPVVLYEWAVRDDDV